jgi:hypothetical protein
LASSGLVPLMRGKVRTADWEIRELATRSHGIVTRRELLGAGLSPKQIENRLGKGVLAPIHRGVYRAGHLAPSIDATYFGAVKACGAEALLAGRAAAHLWGLTKTAPPKAEVLTTKDRRIPGVIVHRARRSEPSDAAERNGIPVTNVPRTLVNIASSLPAPALARACHEAGVKYRTTPRQVEAVLARLPNAPGRAKLRRVIGAKVPVTLSRLESRFLSRLRKAGLPLPITNRMAGSRRVDCRWPEQRLTVELDSYRFHNSRRSWEQDRLREREARMRGDEFRRYSWADVFEDPAFMVAELRRLLA